MKINIKQKEHYLEINKSKTGTYNIEEIESLIDLNNYTIFKATSRQRKVSKEDLLYLKYSSFMLFDNTIDIDELNERINYCYDILKQEIKFMHKPLFDVTKINVIQYSELK